jgi:hypothetical protein
MLNVILQVPYLFLGLYSFVFYLCTALYLLQTVFKYIVNRNAYNFTTIEWIAQFVFALIALEAFGGYADYYLTASGFGPLSQGMVMIMIFIHNIFYLFKIIGAVFMAIFYIYRVFINFQNQEYRSKSALIDIGLAGFFGLLLFVYSINREGNFFGAWNTIERFKPV